MDKETCEKLTPDEEEILKRLQNAYKSINSLKETPTHKKVMLEIEQKIRRQKRAESSK
ncbi:MAG: hypothetical protein IKO42_03185 [Opitutales bacterium]|nr:hypothetical protein [Opitutales bacterium]